MAERYVIEINGVRLRNDEGDILRMITKYVAQQYAAGAVSELIRVKEFEYYRTIPSLSTVLFDWYIIPIEEMSVIDVNLPSWNPVSMHYLRDASTIHQNSLISDAFSILEKHQLSGFFAWERHDYSVAYFMCFKDLAQATMFKLAFN